jgi:hypothetical protein
MLAAPPRALLRTARTTVFASPPITLVTMTNVIMRFE